MLRFECQVFSSRRPRPASLRYPVLVVINLRSIGLQMQSIRASLPLSSQGLRPHTLKTLNIVLPAPHPQLATESHLSKLDGYGSQQNAPLPEVASRVKQPCLPACRQPVSAFVNIPGFDFEGVHCANYSRALYIYSRPVFGLHRLFHHYFNALSLFESCRHTSRLCLVTSQHRENQQRSSPSTRGLHTRCAYQED